MPPVFTDKGITAVVFLLYLFHIALELYRIAVLNKHADFTKALPWVRDVAAEVMRRCQCRCNSFRTVQCPSSATAVECLGGRGVLVYRSFLAHIIRSIRSIRVQNNSSCTGGLASMCQRTGSGSRSKYRSQMLTMCSHSFGGYAERSALSCMPCSP